MMKEEHTIMTFAALLAAATWVAVAAIDSVVFHEGTFVESLFSGSLFVVVLLVFGYVNARRVRKYRVSEELAQKQATAIESSMDGIAICDSGNEYVFVNEAYAKLNGYDSAAEIIGKAYCLMYDEQERVRMDQICMPSLLKNKKWRGELVATRKNGSTYFQEASVTMLEDGSRICIVRDTPGASGARRGCSGRSVF